MDNNLHKSSQNRKYEAKHESQIKHSMEEESLKKFIKDYLGKNSKEKDKYQFYPLAELKEKFEPTYNAHKKKNQINEAWERNIELYNLTVKLNKVIEESGMTLNELAAKTKLKQSSLSNYTNGKAEMSASVLAKLSKFFNISSDYLLGIDACDKTPSDKLKGMTYTDLSADAIERLHDNKNNPEHPLYSMLSSYLIEKGYFDQMIYLLESALVQKEQSKILYPENDKNQKSFLENLEYQCVKDVSTMYTNIITSDSSLSAIAEKVAVENLQELKVVATDVMYRMSKILDTIHKMDTE